MLVGSHIGGDVLLSALGSSTVEYDIIRVALIAILLGLVFSTPPRSLVFRTLLSVTAVALVVGSVGMLLNYQAKLLDAIVFIQIAIVFAIEATEASLRVGLSVEKEHSVYQS